MLDSGLVLFVGLLALVLWRFFSQQCSSRWLIYANYCSALYFILLLLLIYGLVLFVHAGMLLPEGAKGVRAGTAPWLHPFCAFSTLALLLTYGLCAVQTFYHIERIKGGHAAAQHERVVMIIALPAIYGVMALSSLARLCQTAESIDGQDSTLVRRALAQSDTCFRVGDLYEAWVLYQFGKLTLELIKTALAKQEASREGEDRGTARGLLIAHTAVESQMWLGTWMFVVVCVLQSGWSCWMRTFATPQASGTMRSIEGQFNAAGMVASMAAMYNVHTVERTYSCFLESYSPWLKFVSVKILVSFAFFQRGVLYFLQAFQKTLPSMLGKVLPSMPVVREVIEFSPIQIEIFYAALILYEVFIIAALHGWAWNTTEEWYEEYAESEESVLLGASKNSGFKGTSSEAA